MPSAAYEESQSARLYNDASLPFHCNGTNRLIRFEEKKFPQLLGVVVLGGFLKF